jgi:UDP-N-acetylglucosamine--N-acetylmuramyl-(pentapeptide) pyrophosphoryl-undecaprenol N-acetylglucosamine transferase
MKGKILIVGGHLTPALAVLSELRKNGYTNIVWVGQKYNQLGNSTNSAEYITVSKLGIPFINLSSGKLNRHLPITKFYRFFWDLFMVFVGILRSFWIVGRQQPKLIISFGGYTAVPIAIAGWVFRKKIITHEQTVVTGLSNKIISKFANKVLVSWDTSMKYYPAKKTILVGNPIRREVLVSKTDFYTKELDSKRPTVVVMGGNQGSHFINSRIFEVVDKLIDDVNVIHQTGSSTATGDFAKAKELKNTLRIDKRNRYIVTDYIASEHIGEVFNTATLIVCRGGANTITEILALGKLAVVIPIPNTSHDEQVINARYVEKTGLGYTLLQDSKLKSETLYQTILIGLNQNKSKKGFNGDNIEKCKEFAKSLIDLDAPKKIFAVIEEVINPTK